MLTSLSAATLVATRMFDQWVFDELSELSLSSITIHIFGF